MRILLFLSNTSSFIHLIFLYALIHPMNFIAICGIVINQYHITFKCLMVCPVNYVLYYSHDPRYNIKLFSELYLFIVFEVIEINCVKTCSQDNLGTFNI